jgi:hypothetical protein
VSIGVHSVKDSHGAAKPISIGAFSFCVFTITAFGRLHIHELVFDLLPPLQAKFLRFFGANHPPSRKASARQANGHE